MPQDWSANEVEAILEDYFQMLQAELRGEEYNKATHRKQLASRLNNRSDGAIEWKHQNISAALIELGFPYISGYKPAWNYQALLLERAVEVLESHPDLKLAAEQDARKPVRLPEVEDILKTLVNPPMPSWRRADRLSEELPAYQPQAKREMDFLALEARNRSLGDAGEEFAVRYEKARLIHAGHPGLADKVERVSETRGPWAGFDILSFEKGGQDRYVEVKTTKYGKETPFYVSRNELRFSIDRGPGYHLYRLFEFQRRTRFFVLQGSLDKTCCLDCVEYRVRV